VSRFTLTEAPSSGEARNGLEEFLAVGNRLAELMVEAGLEDTDRVLDIGCGSGRIAASLANVLTTGRYEGFDVDKSRIAWAKAHIELPQFTFRHVKVKNAMYSRRSRKRGSDFTFPYPDGSFDFAIATSLFTHLAPDDAAHYLRETARVLDTGGTLFATFFIVDEFALAEVRAGHTQWLREERPDGAWVHDPAKPEIAIGFPPEWLEKTMLDAGLTIDAIRFGSWSGREAPVDYQDIVIASTSGA
jgi:cyclopropane fatty-acyl-phospholipid synthase-like methyltransferase